MKKIIFILLYLMICIVGMSQTYDTIQAGQIYVRTYGNSTYIDTFDVITKASSTNNSVIPSAVRYVSNNGNDSYNGLSPDSAFACCFINFQSRLYSLA